MDSLYLEGEISEDPIVVCPACKKEFQIDESYEYDVGDDYECPECETVIEMIEGSRYRVWYWATAEDCRKVEENRKKRRKERMKKDG